MQYSTSLIILSIATSSLSHPLQTRSASNNATTSNATISNANSVSRICGTGPPGVALRDTHAQLHRESREANLQPRKADLANEIVVDTYMHLVTTVDQASGYTPEKIANLVSNQVCFPRPSKSRTSFTLSPLLHSYTSHSTLQRSNSSIFIKS